MFKKFLFAVALTLGLVTSSWAAVTHVQTEYNSGSSTGSVSATLTLTGGNAVIVTVLTYFQATTFTQTAGDTLTETVSQTANQSHNMRQYIAHSVAGGSTTFTFTFTSSNNAAIFVSEFSGLATSNAFDQSAVGTVETANYSTGTTGTTTQDDELLYTVLHLDGGGSTSNLAVNNSFIVPTNGDQVGSGPVQKSAVAYRIVGSSSTYTMDFTTTDAQDGMAMIGTYKAAAGGASTPAGPFRRRT